MAGPRGLPARILFGVVSSLFVALLRQARFRARARELVQSALRVIAGAFYSTRKEKLLIVDSPGASGGKIDPLVPSAGFEESSESQEDIESAIRRLGATKESPGSALPWLVESENGDPVEVDDSVTAALEAGFGEFKRKENSAVCGRQIQKLEDVGWTVDFVEMSVTDRQGHVMRLQRTAPVLPTQGSISPVTACRPLDSVAATLRTPLQELSTNKNVTDVPVVPAKAQKAAKVEEVNNSVNLSSPSEIPGPPAVVRSQKHSASSTGITPPRSYRSRQNSASTLSGSQAARRSPRSSEGPWVPEDAVLAEGWRQAAALKREEGRDGGAGRFWLEALLGADFDRATRAWKVSATSPEYLFVAASWLRACPGTRIRYVLRVQLPDAEQKYMSSVGQFIRDHPSISACHTDGQTRLTSDEHLAFSVPGPGALPELLSGGLAPSSRSLPGRSVHEQGIEATGFADARLNGRYVLDAARGDPLWVMKRSGPCPRLFWARSTGGWLIAVGNAEPVAYAEDPTGHSLQTARWAEKEPTRATWLDSAAKVGPSAVAVAFRVLDRRGASELSALPLYAVEFVTSAEAVAR